MNTRRRFLATAATFGGVALAGCSGGEAGSGGPTTARDDGSGGGSTAEESGDATTTATTSDLQTRAGTADLSSQPTLGPDPEDATGVVVAFEDPSCTICGRWERNTFPELKSKLVDTGKASFVFRGYPVVYPWGKPAAKALEATYSRDADAFWELNAHYFENQGSFDRENVLSKTESFLADTDVDGAAVVAAVENGDADAAVDADLSAGEAAGIQGTPGFLLFRDGEFQTKVVGAQSYSVFATAMGF